METKLAYFDESGDDGIGEKCSPQFVLTSVCVDASNWHKVFDDIVNIRNELKELYGLPTIMEMHMKNFFYDHDPYRDFGWTPEIRKNLLIQYIKSLASLDISVVNVLIDKSAIKDMSYPILETALKYNIQRIENTYKNDYNFIVISDEGRVGMMRKTARKMQKYNSIPSHYYARSTNIPISGMIEDILEKNSADSYFIQIADNISYFVNLYYKYVAMNMPLPKRISNVFDKEHIIATMKALKNGGVLNLKATSKNQYGIVIYPR